MKIMFEVKNVDFVKYELICHFCLPVRSIISMGKGRVLNEWFSRKDAQDCVINTWAEKYDNDYVLCKACSKTFSVASSGFDAVKQHSSGKTHVSRYKDYQQQLLLKIVPSSQEQASTSGKILSVGPQLQDRDEDATTKPTPSVPTIQLYRTRDKTTAAEMRWVLKCVASNFQRPPATALPSFLLKCSALKRLETLV